MSEALSVTTAVDMINKLEELGVPLGDSKEVITESFSALLFTWDKMSRDEKSQLANGVLQDWKEWLPRIKPTIDRLGLDDDEVAKKSLEAFGDHKILKVFLRCVINLGVAEYWSHKTTAFLNELEKIMPLGSNREPIRKVFCDFMQKYEEEIRG